MPPTHTHELKLLRQGYKLIAGVDEVGRGPLAGPVVAAAVILPAKQSIRGLDDSKKLSEEKRNSLYKIITQKAVSVGIGIVDNIEIDRTNILKASLLAMKQAVENLEFLPDFVLIDGNQKISQLKIKQKTVIKGDSKVASIAAASIIAKVMRDNLMSKLHNQFPQYNFKKHKGYGTREHFSAIDRFGPCPIHRFSWQSVSQTRLF